MKKLLLLIALLGTSLTLNAKEKVYKAAEFGILPGIANVTPLVEKAIAKIKSENPNGEPTKLLFGKGKYNFDIQGAQLREYYISNHDQDNPKTMGIVIEDMKNFTLDGAGADFQFLGRMLPISLVNCTGCTLENFSIDNPNPQIAQIEILTNDTAAGVITYKIAPWVNYRIENGKFIAFGKNWEHTPTSGIAFENKTKHLVYNTSDISVGTKNVKEIAPRTIEVAWKNDKLIPGTVIACRSWHRPTPGIFMSHDNQTKLLNIQVHYSEGMGLLAQMSDDILLDKFSVCLRGAKDPRYFTAQADATHFSACKGVVKSVNGLYENMMDDAINVHGTYLKVIKRISDTKIIAKYMQPQSYGFEWGNVGDTVQFINSQTMELIDNINSIAAIKPHDLPQIRGAKEYEIDFVKPIDATISEKGVYGVENLEWTPQIIFEGNTVRNNRARGSLFSTPKPTLIKNNIFDHTSGTAILLCGDCNGWFETGACRDVLITGNKFINSLTNMFQFTNAIISIYPEIPNLKDQKKYFHGGSGKGVVIENNIFETFDMPLVYAKSLDGLIFRGNTIKTNTDYPAFHWNKSRFLFERVVNYEIKDNKFDGGFDQAKDVKIKN